MIIRIISDKRIVSESYTYIYCPNNINIKRKNIKFEFIKWELSSETWDTERDKEFFELHKVGYGYCYDLEDMMIYWINKYLLDYEHGDKAYLLESNKNPDGNYDMEINADGISI
ncbi:hypothetical protein [Terrisporobacter mayombei]|uniref:Uncharacterized protein n=1 Tax=Terrisporobacter mayombei TaxID=1541 RepID=A0ABY9Q6Y3_9FIRM|nr:hypothetical protein [Terrisporobacter mayombei]MCC3869042.1 hypothetical protein [Terrisporobacter mayombei]WMT82825.1 hypothetical protein TEMA_33170 [Terrisporobacter mayombei]